MIDVSTSSSAISPRMSICLKGTAKLLDENDLWDMSESLHGEMSDISFLGAEDSSDCDTATAEDTQSVSILLTGTSFPILAPSEGVDKRRQEKSTLQRKGVRFSDTIHTRTHISVAEMTGEEKLAAWFRKPEYRLIFKNNMKIIHNIGWREKELKRMISKQKKHDKKKKKKQSNTLDDPCLESLNESESMCSDDISTELIIGIHRDDEQGFSVRGLENETKKKRKLKDQTYLRAKFAVLSVQEDMDDHMFSMQEDYEKKLNALENAKKKSAKKKKTRPTTQGEDEVSETIEEKAAAFNEEFSEYAKKQYHKMIKLISEKYGEICKQDAKDALERGLQDERTARAIDLIESEGYSIVENYSVSMHSSGKGMSDASLELEKRRPSTTSTAATEDSASAVAITNNRFKLGRMKRAKMFLRKYV